MKKIIFVSLLSLLCFLPQLQAHTIPLGTLAISTDTTLNFSKSSTDSDLYGDSDEKEFDIKLTGYYYFVENLGFGLSTLFNKSDGDGIDSMLFGIGPGFSIDMPLEEELNFNVKGMVGFVWGDIEIKDSYYYNIDADIDGYAIQASVGFNYFFRDNISLDYAISYSKMDLDYDIKNYYRDLSEDREGYGFSIGFTIYLQ